MIQFLFHLDIMYVNIFLYWRPYHLSQMNLEWPPVPKRPNFWRQLQIWWLLSPEFEILAIYRGSQTCLAQDNYKYKDNYKDKDTQYIKAGRLWQWWWGGFWMGIKSRSHNHRPTKHVLVPLPLISNTKTSAQCTHCATQCSRQKVLIHCSPCGLQCHWGDLRAHVSC